MPFTTPARRLTAVEDATFELAGGSMGADPKEPLLTDLRNQTRLSELEAVLLTVEAWLVARQQTDPTWGRADFSPAEVRATLSDRPESF
jgi:hypothetical protein